MCKLIYKYFFTLTTIVAFVGCYTSEHTNFKLARHPYTLKDTVFLKTNGVYMNVQDSSSYGLKDLKGSKVYSFIRFYKNGRCFFSNDFHTVSIDTLVSTSKELGQRTFYKIINDTSIVIETWGGSYAGYMYEEGVVRGENVIIVSTKDRGLGTMRQIKPVKEIYVFRKMSVTEQADW